MIEEKIIIQNRAGIHARPAAILVQLIKNYSCDIYLEKGNYRINAKSIMGIITLGAAYGTEIKIIAEGDDEKNGQDEQGRGRQYDARHV